MNIPTGYDLDRIMQVSKGFSYEDVIAWQGASGLDFNRGIATPERYVTPLL